MERKEILLAGAGGQGILFFGSILSRVAFQKGKWVLTTPTYGASVRGGEVKCTVIVCDTEIEDPLVDDADIAVILNDASLIKFGSKVKQQGTLIYNDTKDAGKIVETLEKKPRLIPIPLRELGPERYQNMIALGALLKMEPDLNGGFVKEALVEEIMKKSGRQDFIEDNMKYFQVGGEWYLAQGR